MRDDTFLWEFEHKICAGCFLGQIVDKIRVWNPNLVHNVPTQLHFRHSRGGAISQTRVEPMLTKKHHECRLLRSYKNNKQPHDLYMKHFRIYQYEATKVKRQVCITLLHIHPIGKHSPPLPCERFLWGEIFPSRTNTVPLKIIPVLVFFGSNLCPLPPEY